MPRACSTLLQNIFAQNPNFYATPTDGAIELLDGARQRFTDSVEFKASVDQDLSLSSWRNFCKGGLISYCNTLTDKPNIVLKGRGWKGNINWMENFLNEEPKIFCCVRNLKSIVASFEKLHRKNPDKTSQWLINHEARGTTVFIRAENLTSNPQEIMNQVYDILGEERYQHNFNNIEQITKENDVIHALDNDLHTIKSLFSDLSNNDIKILLLGTSSTLSTPAN